MLAAYRNALVVLMNSKDAKMALRNRNDSPCATLRKIELSNTVTLAGGGDVGLGAFSKIHDTVDTEKHPSHGVNRLPHAARHVEREERVE